jgi:spermidine/putrescine transport system ATP-binding protein
MNDGFIVQIGSPREIYEQPTNQFVADFVGQTNFIRGTVAALDSDGRARVATGIGELKVHAADGAVCDAAGSVRPET